MEYGSAVVYVKDGKPLNALVVKSAADSLSLIYLDPANESSVSQGNLRQVAAVAIGVKPLIDGAKFGWVATLADVPTPIMPDPTSHEDVVAASLASKIKANLEKASNAVGNALGEAFENR